MFNKTIKLNVSQLIFLVTIFITFMGQIYIRPFNTDFRLTFAVVVLNILMVFIRDIPPVKTTFSVGILMFIVRSIVYSISSGVPILDSIIIYLPVISFYIFYGFFFIVFKVRYLINQPLRLLLALWLCDSFPNIIEFSIRLGWRYTNFEQGILTIVVIALIRSLFSVSFIMIAQHLLNVYRERQSHSEFVYKVISTANLKTELFFLKKSKRDIENTMKRSYDIYQEIEDEGYRQALLTVTKDIHEIKKDYTRVIAGLERSVNLAPIYDMCFDEILDIVVETNRNVAYSLGKHIQFIRCNNTTIRTIKFYGLISIVNNLVINAVEAIKSHGKISINIKQEDTLIIEVSDDGVGISKDEQNIIFNPGFSTKYNEKSGVMSSGVGLTHVKGVVKNVFDGTVYLDKEKVKGTVFVVKIPLEKILIKDEDMDNEL